MVELIQKTVTTAREMVEGLCLAKLLQRCALLILIVDYHLYIASVASVQQCVCQMKLVLMASHCALPPVEAQKVVKPV